LSLNKHADKTKRNTLSKLGLHYKPLAKQQIEVIPKKRQKNQFLDKSCWNKLYKIKNTNNSRREEEEMKGEEKKKK
jgi:hypothetical protein